MIEEPLQFGEGGRLCGILTSPEEPTASAGDLPVFVFLNSGLLHRVGPRRLYVRLARELSEMGFTSLRVDLAGRGDSHHPVQATDGDPLGRDWTEIGALLESRGHGASMIPGGLCSAADDAIRVAADDPRVVGMLLLDPVCARDRGFRARELWQKYTNPARYVVWLRRRIRMMAGTSAGPQEAVDYLSLRDCPTPELTKEAFESIRDRGGRVLTVFTAYATEYLNQAGQMGRVLGVDGYDDFCTELFWPSAAHSFTLETHRARLVETVKEWADRFRAH